MPLSAPCVSAMGELAKTRGDARSYFTPPFQYFLFTSSHIFSSCLTLGPNELCSLVVIGNQMCCHSCQCNGLVCDANTHKLTHRGHCQLIKTVTMHKCLCCPILLSSLSTNNCPVPLRSFSFLSLPRVAPPASPLKLHSVGPYVLRRDPQMCDQ